MTSGLNCIQKIFIDFLDFSTEKGDAVDTIRQTIDLKKILKVADHFNFSKPKIVLETEIRISKRATHAVNLPETLRTVPLL